MKFNALLASLTAGTNTLPADQKAMQARISTLAGCEALRDELQAAKQGDTPYGPAARLLGRQLGEANRLVMQQKIHGDQDRLTAVFKRDADATAKALKLTEGDLKKADALAESTAADVAKLVARVATMEAQLTTERSDAAKLVAQANEAFQTALKSGDVDSETTAADALYRAQKFQTDAGGSLALRIKGLQGEVARLEQLASDARETQISADGSLALARFNEAALKSDQALQGAYDAYLEAMVTWYQLPSKLQPQCAIAEFEAGFASPERALLGSILLGDRNRIKKYVSADFVRALAPAKLALLAEIPAIEVAPVQEAGPNPFAFTPGSMQHHNALVAQEEFRNKAQATAAA